MTASSGNDCKLPVLILASASPRRQALLRQIGIEFDVVIPDVDEIPRPDESAQVLVERLALEKAKRGRELVRQRSDNLPLLGADTAIALDNEILGKPENREHGIDMLTRLAGRTHEVLTAVALVNGAESQRLVSRSRVTVGPLTADEIRAYWDSGEPADKAGAYAIQGRAAAFIEYIEGSYTGVVGLPVYEVAQMLKKTGLRP